MIKQPRNLFFDVLRIVCIFLIVYAHHPYWNLNGSLFQDGWAFIVYPTSLAMIAVYALIFVSGAVLELNYQRVASLSESGRFFFRRLLRLYPALWMSLIFAILILPPLIGKELNHLVLESSGFYIWLGEGNPVLNPMGWFIGTIIPLYLLFPLLSPLIRKYHLGALGLLAAITFLSRYYFLYISQYALAYRFLPLCNLFEFAFGIYLIQMDLYPKNSMEHPIISELSELTFYVFLFHNIILGRLGPVVMLPVGGIGPLSDHDAYYILFAAEILFISALAMVFDKTVQDFVKAKVLHPPS